MTKAKDTPPTRPSLHVLGGLALHGVSAESSDRLLTQSKAIALLVYLLLSKPGVFQRRDRIIGYLWPEQDQQHARASLRKTIYVIRSNLGENILTTRGDDDIAINPEHLTCDAAQLRAEVDLGHFAAAVDLYHGDLMPGFYLAGCGEYDVWLEERRKELHEFAIHACLELARFLESAANGTQAGAYARRAARLAGTNERVLRRCMIMLDRLGDRAGAIDAYDEFARRLLQQMDAEPSAETVALANSLRRSNQSTSRPAGPR